MGNTELSAKWNKRSSYSGKTPKDYNQIVNENSAMDLDTKISSALLPDDVVEEEKMEMNKKKLKLQAQYSQLEYKVKYFDQKPSGNQDGKLNETNNQIKNRYEGTFKDGLIFGQGILFYPSGSIYMGGVKNGGRGGQGVFYFSNGDVYSGQWSENDQNGIGKLYFIKDGKLVQLYSGYFKDSKYCGFGCYCYQNTYYLGFWKDDQFHGHGKIFSFEGKLIECGIFKQDKLVVELQEDKIVFPDNWSIYLPNLSSEKLHYENLVENKPVL